MTLAEPPCDVERDVGGRPHHKCRSILTHSLILIKKSSEDFFRKSSIIFDLVGRKWMIRFFAK